MKAINKPAAYVFFFFCVQNADCLVEFEYLPLFGIHEKNNTYLNKNFFQNKQDLNIVTVRLVRVLSFLK